MPYARRQARNSRPSWLALFLAALGAFLLGLGRLPYSSAAPEAMPPAATVIESVSEPAPVGNASALTAASETAALDPIAIPEPPAAVAPETAAPAALEPASPRIRDIGDLRRPRVRAAAAMLYNPRTEEVLWERRGLDQRPIASITKVMTALVLLDQEPELARDVVVSRRDVRRASTTYLRRGERVTLDTLLNLALIASDNVAARILARASGWGTRRFVEQMNLKAAALGLTHTRFVEPSGLDERNVSTPYDVARLIAIASEVPALSEIMRKRTHRVRTDRRRMNIRNTNRLLRSRHVIQGGKTGYIDEAGFCLTALVELPDADPIALVVLGAGSNERRFSEARRLIEWVSTTGRPLLEPAESAN
jgi:D-alanyl-D-alanine endopeptidase (penicillin-binding protein 7)